MDPVLVVIARPGSGALDREAVTRLRRLVAGEPRWLADAEALEVPLTPLGPKALRPTPCEQEGGGPSASEDRVRGVENELRSALADRPIDIAVVPGDNRGKRLLLADMDSTLIEQEVVDELADLAGIGAAVSAITERAMRGEIAFEPALRERVALLKDLPMTAVETAIRERITLTPGVATLVSTMKHHGAFTAIVSGGFTAFTGHVAATLGVDSHAANRLLVENGRLTGAVAEPILGKTAKVDTLKRLVGELGIAFDDVIAVGDGANDVPMLQLAGLGVAFRAKPAVRAAAPISVDHGDLTALLYLQGYRKADFVG